jgi:Tol biopolymer transport system component
MSKLKNKCLIMLMLAALCIVQAQAISPATAHGNIRGKLVYTAEVPSLSPTDLMFTITLGSHPENGRSHIAGDTMNSAAYPRSTKDGLMILCHAFPDADGDGIIEENTATPLIGVLQTDGTDLTAITTPAEGAAYNASFSPDERHVAFSYANTDTNGDGLFTIQDSAQLAIKELGPVDPLNPNPRQLASKNRITALTNRDDFSATKPVFLRNDMIVFTGKNPDDGSTKVYLYDLGNNNLIPLAPPGAQTRNPAVSEDGTRIALEVVTLTEHYDAVYDIQSQTWSRLPSAGLTENAFAWSVNGTLALAVSNGSMWQILLLEGSGLRKLVEIPQKISMLDFSPDGKAIAYLWDVDGSNHNVLAVASLDGGYNASVTSQDSMVKDYDWIPED